MLWIDASASRERKFVFQFLAYLSSSVCRNNVISISIQFTGNDKVRIFYTSNKVRANWMYAARD